MRPTGSGTFPDSLAHHRELPFRLRNGRRLFRAFHRQLLLIRQNEFRNQGRCRGKLLYLRRRPYRQAFPVPDSARSATPVSLTSISVSALMLPALILLFGRKLKQQLTLKVGVIVGVILLMVPLFGYIFSGFSTVNNRWSFGFVFLLAIVFMTSLTGCGPMPKKQYLIFAAAVVLYGVCWMLTDPGKILYAAAFILLAAALLCWDSSACGPQRFLSGFKKAVCSCSWLSPWRPTAM